MQTLLYALGTAHEQRVICNTDIPAYPPVGTMFTIFDDRGHPYTWKSASPAELVQKDVSYLSTDEMWRQEVKCVPWSTDKKHER